MNKYVSGHTTAIIVLHEIYGINDFIKDVCQQYHEENYDVFCPDLYDHQVIFSYAQDKQAYNTYMTEVGFDIYQRINIFAEQLKKTYTKVILIGFSVGATLAWRCSESSFYNRIICCYGSRIRDYTEVEPRCPVLLVFAKYDSFDVEDTKNQLEYKDMVSVEIMEGKHGFLDSYSNHYNQSSAYLFDKIKNCFLQQFNKEG